MVYQALTSSQPRGRGRPVGADSEATRRNLLDAAREVIAERGFRATTFQLIAQRAGVTRPTLHYYFSAREHVYEILLADAHARMTECAAAALREHGLRDQLTVFLAAIQQLNITDRATMRFLVTARLEHQRGQQRHHGADAVVASVHGFYRAIVARAIERGELASATDARAVADMLAAVFWGMGFHAGFIEVQDTGEDTGAVARQFLRVLDGGLLNMPVGAPVRP